eukprot:Gb_07952 [translate_table: standard]
MVLVDPFRVLEQILVLVPEDVEVFSLAQVDKKETPKAHVFTVDVLGMNKEEMKIKVEKNRVMRIIRELLANVNLDDVKANLENGVLIVIMPKFSDEMKSDVEIVDSIENLLEKGQEIRGKVL